MAKKFPFVIRLILGIIFIILGIVGIILPILQGWFFLLIGFTFLGWDGGKKLAKNIRSKFK